MAVNLPPVPQKAPILDQNGNLSARWSAWFKILFGRVGGHSAFSIGEDASISTAQLQAECVTPAKVAASVAGNGLSGGAGSALSVAVDNSTVEVSGDALRVKGLGIGTDQIAAEAVSFAKLLSTDWTSNKTNNGYFKLGSGLYVQWGVTGSLASGSATTVSFPIAFPTTARQVIAGVRDNSAIALTTTGQWGTGGYSASSFALYNRTSSALTFNWIAIGY